MKRPCADHRAVSGRALLLRPATGRCGAGSPEPRSVVDPTGRTVRVPADPRRVVALAPSVTEIVYALGQEARLVGVTRYSNYPPAAEQLPLVGSYIQLDVERIVALRPDLCIAVKDGNPIAAVEQLESLGLAVFAINPLDLETVMQSVLAMGGLLGAEPRAANGGRRHAPAHPEGPGARGPRPPAVRVSFSRSACRPSCRWAATPSSTPSSNWPAASMWRPAPVPIRAFPGSR